MDTNYPRFTLDGCNIEDQQSNNLFLIISQPTSRCGAPRFPKLMEVIGWILVIQDNIDASIQDNHKGADLG
eukprot:11414533-Heterocapsa_arctica.AAC.1